MQKHCTQIHYYFAVLPSALNDTQHEAASQRFKSSAVRHAASLQRYLF